MSFQMRHEIQELYKQEFLSYTQSERDEYLHDLRIYTRNRIWSTQTIEELQWIASLNIQLSNEFARGAPPSGTEIDVSEATLRT